MKTAVTNIIIILGIISVSNITVTVSSTDLVEFNSSVSLSCSSSGSSLSFLWLNGSSVVTATDRVQLTDGGRNLTIVSVSRYDQGPFRCRVSSGVINGISEPVNLSISYGPESISLKTSPTKDFYVTGSNVDLSCSAVSSPAAQFTWFLNRTQLNDTGPELRLTNIQTCQSGNYSCQAFNTKTLRYQTSQPSALNVLDNSEECGRLSPAAITRIVIACVLVFGGVLAGGLCICVIESKLLYFSRSNSSAQPHKTEHRDTVYENNHVAPQALSLAPGTRG
ncbi:carcinoembryonic antigen-related cell adhesion molecule 1-like isoform X2 [Betta splendens]|uniref:Carcinoembryonic antigen-related cell adhesion molecule 1-like isoform X2 n=1 Tax=Betta splendens TaxID=158456 RepID=A0A9W2XC39_BETSP|nr:carcinoembryonic antigen-related cell adhesion molecule 1-like isoform X2 [Betta splendens]